jgi:hypothetical protein
VKLIGYMAQVSATSAIVSGGAPKFMGYVGIPGNKGDDGDKGDKGDPGEVGGSLPWAQITSKPIDIYMHTEPIPSSLWIINHNLGYKPPSVTVEDHAGRVMRGVISNPSVNQTRIEFNPPAAGTARIF